MANASAKAAKESTATTTRRILSYSTALDSESTIRDVRMARPKSPERSSGDCSHNLAW
ncbi:hypothetical protein SynA1560_01481 [Synechococcus sp. A15-60]|nr:hypothetical protein SynA1560_01481 [Synechococcus sp. A15-60]